MVAGSVMGANAGQLLIDMEWQNIMGMRNKR